MELDHVVVLVNDLEAAMQHWRNAGFTLTPGGVHADGLTHNALICFSDGSYIELLAFRTTASTVHRWERFRSFPGLIDYAVAVRDLPLLVQHVRERGLSYSTVAEGGRRRPDGVAIQWRTSWPPHSSEGLPFLIEDLTPRELRVPSGNPRTHPNAAQGIAEVNLAVNNLEQAAHDLAILFGAGREANDSSKTFAVGNAALRLRQPVQGNERTLIAQRGPGPVSLLIARQSDDVWRYP